MTLLLLIIGIPIAIGFLVVVVLAIKNPKAVIAFVAGGCVYIFISVASMVAIFCLVYFVGRPAFISWLNG